MPDPLNLPTSLPPMLLQPSVMSPPRPLAAMGPAPTLMLVEDSRYASEVMRLYARMLGMRLRRAADMATAQAHLRLYRPDILLIDLGLPDGRGEDLISQICAMPHRPPLIIATSGEGGRAKAALAAGADLFLEKPLPDIAQFRALLVDHFPQPLPLLLLPPSPKPPQPDPIALHDDLHLAADALAQVAQSRGQAGRQYLAGFLEGVGVCLGDQDLKAAAHGELVAAKVDELIFQPQHPATPPPDHTEFRKLSDLVQQRLRDVLAQKGI